MSETLDSITLGPAKQIEQTLTEWPSTVYDQDLGLHIGPPSLREDGIAGIPAEPHVFTTNKLLVTHGDIATQSDDLSILVAHGYNRDGKWVFDDGRDVAEVVTTFNNSVDDVRKIKFLAVCNPGEVSEDATSLKSLSDQGIVFAVGSKVGVTILPSPDHGGIEVDVTVLDDSGSITNR